MNNTENSAPAAQAVESASPFINQIRDYLTNKGSASLKQVQSRFKEVSYTCKDYYDLLNRNGFVLNGGGSAYSTYSVSVE